MIDDKQQLADLLARVKLLEKEIDRCSALLDGIDSYQSVGAKRFCPQVKKPRRVDSQAICWMELELPLFH